MLTRLLLPLALAATLAACGDGDPAATGSPTASASPTSPGATPVKVCEAEAPVDGGVKVSGAAGERPEITIPDTKPPCNLIAHDIQPGTGAEVQATSTLTVHYVGVSWSTKQAFDASWDGGQPATFGLNQVIPGWQQGLAGARKGARRLLVIPPELAYGEQGAPGAIGPNETLVFVVDIVDVS